MAKKPAGLLLRGSIYHTNFRTPTDIVRAFPEEPEHHRRSLGTDNFYEAKHLAALVLKKLEARWASMRTEQEDEIAAAIRQERTAVEAFGDVPWPTIAEKVGSRLERLAKRLGVLEEFQAAKRVEEFPEALSEHREGEKLLRDLDRAKGILTWSQAGEEFLRQGTVKPATGATYAAQWSKADAANVPGPQRVTREQARDYLRKRRDAGAAASTLNSIITAMSALMEFTFPDNDAKNSLWKKLKIKAKVEKRGNKRRDITGDELAKILKGQHWTVVTAAKLAVHTGFRVEELYKAQWNVADRTATLSGDLKTESSARSIPIHGDIIDDVKRWTTDRTRQARNTVVTSFSRAKHKAGFGPEVTFHSTRHAFATALGKTKLSMERRALLCGHASKEMQARYTHLGVEDLREDVNKLDWSTVNWGALARS